MSYSGKKAELAPNEATEAPLPEDFGYSEPMSAAVEPENEFGDRNRMYKVGLEVRLPYECRQMWGRSIFANLVNECDFARALPEVTIRECSCDEDWQDDRYDNQGDDMDDDGCYDDRDDRDTNDWDCGTYADNREDDEAWGHLEDEPFMPWADTPEDLWAEHLREKAISDLHLLWDAMREIEWYVSRDETPEDYPGHEMPVRLVEEHPFALTLLIRGWRDVVLPLY